MKRSIKTIGINTRTQDSTSYPFLQIIFRIQVQTKTYNILIAKSPVIFELGQDCVPTQ